MAHKLIKIRMARCPRQQHMMAAISVYPTSDLLIGPNQIASYSPYVDMHLMIMNYHILAVCR